MVLKLYGLAMSTCAQRVLITLKEKNVEYELVPVDLMKGAHKSPEFLEKQPFGKIPYLDDDGFIVYESRAICRYIENKYKGQGTELIPTEVKEAAIFEQGASIELSYYNEAVSVLAYENIFKGMFQPGSSPDAATVKSQTEKLAASLDAYEKVLSKQPYIGGNSFTLADVFHIPYGELLFKQGLGDLLSGDQRPHVKEWWNKISSRSSWQEVKKL
ncbi:glutathione S-transferase [Acrasis kona]|uniref:glutathione transferase n=1 Tax=Acrasis kona TaxID=1008807 RepID=A0AAW2ZDN0_9EUKA